MKTMNLILVVILALGFATAFTSCGNSQDKQKSEATSQSVNSEQQPDKVLNSYLKIKDALVQTDSEAASKAALELVKSIGENQNELTKKIRFDAEYISETKDIGHQRDHFNSLSDNVYQWVKNSNSNTDPIYRQYCPMAFDNTGAYWLSAEKEINNPYFGDKMLHCGSLKEEL